jgi:hypothetical protein
MIPYTDQIVELLTRHCVGGEEYIDSVLLASHGLTIKFVEFEIHCNERVVAWIDGTRYEWDDAPNSGPWGALVRQRAQGVSLKNPFWLTITLHSGDSIEIETVEGQYESAVISFPPRDDSIVMEIF